MRPGLRHAWEPTPSPTSQEVIWGDNNCSDEADPVDALIGLRHDAGLPAETNDCPEMGQETPVLGFDTYPWGDVDCSDAVDPVDSLKILRFDAGLSVEQEELCPMLGDLVVIPDA